MSKSSLSRLAVLAAALSLTTAVRAADLIVSPEPMATIDAGLKLPAVSGVNGKLELWGGTITDPDYSTFRAAGSLSVPVGDDFGIQFDGAIGSIDDEIYGGGAVHMFTRDPEHYLFGVTGGYVATDGASLAAIGPEAELYLGRVSLEAWGGWASFDSDFDPLDETGGFFIGDIAYYVTDDWRISAGVSSILGDNAFDLGTEYQFSAAGLPLSLTADFKAYDDDRKSLMIGIKGYFGEPGKSLIDRHRQDDPPNRMLDLFQAAGDLNKQLSPGDYDNESSCEDAGFFWNWDPDQEKYICNGSPSAG